MTEKQQLRVDRLIRNGWRLMNSKPILRKPGENSRCYVYPDGVAIFFQKGKEKF